MKFTTVQALAFKTVFEVLKEILNDVNIYCTDKGIRIITLDTARAALVDLFLGSENFESYSCPTPVTAGVNVSNMFKLFKVITNNDTLHMDISRTEYLNIKIENPTKKSNTHFQFKLLDINEDVIEVPKMNMEKSVVTHMPTVDFQRLCRDMHNIGSEVEIARKGSKIIIRCAGDFANQETVIDSEDSYKGAISGNYSLKYMNLFTKATSMCSTVQLVQIEDQNFLILKYNVANLGTLNFYLAAKSETE